MPVKLNTTYISSALANKLSYISEYPVTSIVAPIGYGKTSDPAADHRHGLPGGFLAELLPEPPGMAGTGKGNVRSWISRRSTGAAADDGIADRCSGREVPRYFLHH